MELKLYTLILKQLSLHTASNFYYKLFDSKPKDRITLERRCEKLKRKAQHTYYQENAHVLDMMERKLKKLYNKTYLYPKFHQDEYMWNQKIVTRTLINQELSQYIYHDHTIKCKLTFSQTTIDTERKAITKETVIEEYNTLDEFKLFASTFDYLYTLSFLDKVKLNSLIKNILLHHDNN